MYSDAEVDAAVAAGALSREAADGLRSHISAQRAGPVVDEEHFRLLTGFNDIFVAIAAVLLLVALAWLGSTIGGDLRNGGPPSPLAGFLPAAAAWGLAEYFTKQRRMALPSIVLLLAFVGGVLAGTGLLIATLHIASGAEEPSRTAQAAYSALTAVATAGAAWLHWRRFRVPITVAAGAAAAIGGVLMTVLSAVGDGDWFLPLLFIGGVVLFALAMWWDGSDRERLTRRSDVAFWLHLAAAPAIAHAVFNGLEVMDGDLGVDTAFAVLALYLLFALVALAIDRRALLVSGLAYVLYAMSSLFERFGAVGLNVALTALVIGSALLLLSAFWHPIRRAVVAGLPGGLQARLPVLDRIATSPKPA